MAKNLRHRRRLVPDTGRRRGNVRDQRGRAAPVGAAAGHGGRRERTLVRHDPLGGGAGVVLGGPVTFWWGRVRREKSEAPA
jgi:hypothetical protein